MTTTADRSPAISDLQRQAYRRAEYVRRGRRITVAIQTALAVDNPADSPYARGAAAGSRLAARLRDRSDWAEIFADMGIMLDAARAETR
jgi:hypothetical protein